MSPRNEVGTRILTNKVKLIGITGHSGTGKSTVAEQLAEYYNDIYITAFADPLKSLCAEAFGIPLEHFYDSEHKEKLVTFWNISPRKIAQFIGSEVFRDRIAQLIPWVKNDFWIERFAGAIEGELNEAHDDLIYYEPGDCIVIPDVRFQNEYDFIIANGGIVIHLIRHDCEGNVGIVGHQSEQPIQFTDLDRTYTIYNNGTIQELFYEVKRIIDSSSLALNDDIPF
jgi:energy-coupling factor transporter ATP-binding protein EcfA2